jgi:hypothetical protein
VGSPHKAFIQTPVPQKQTKTRTTVGSRELGPNTPPPSHWLRTLKVPINFPKLLLFPNRTYTSSQRKPLEKTPRLSPSPGQTMK